MKNFFFTSVLCVSLSGLSYAQFDFNRNNNFPTTAYIHTPTPDETEVRGSRFFFDEAYHQGELWTKTGYFTTELQYRFDQMEGTVQVKTPDGKETLVDENTIIMFHLYIKNKKIVFVRHKLPNSKQDALMQVLFYSGNLQLLRQSKKGLYRDKDSRSGVFHAYYNDYKYYITEADNKPLEEIKLTEKDFLKKFPKHRNKIVQFFKVNDTKKEMTQTKLIHLMERITEVKEDKDNKE